MAFDIKSSDWITIVGWGVTFLLGVLLTILTQRISKKKKKIIWSLVNESNLLSHATQEELETGFGVPVKVFMGPNQVTDLSTIRIKVGNTGNVELQNITLYFRFGDDAKVYVGRYIGDLGVYRKKLSLEKMDNVATLEIAHINKGQSFEVEFLVGQYQVGDIVVDMAEPGVSLKRVSSFRLEAGLGKFEHFSLGFWGVKYDPTATQTSYLVAEVRNLRHALLKYQSDKKENA
ncbi:MAG TPA: hypothetical protein VMW89_19595 [Desulfatiglandales bacterium]|nr:hypothetical protein [Desulfatiglandales bacterium]HUX78563.1 hypothetical protein [Alphaproteobacteria bacterium]